jgi:hypothetical protein
MYEIEAIGELSNLFDFESLGDSSLDYLSELGQLVNLGVVDLIESKDFIVPEYKGVLFSLEDTLPVKLGLLLSIGDEARGATGLNGFSGQTIIAHFEL